VKCLRALQPSVIRTASANAVALLVTFPRGADLNNDRFSVIEFALPSAVPFAHFFGYCGPSSSNATGARICDFKHALV
jgi:hypothetical protein